MKKVRLKAAGISDIGVCKRKNEDSLTYRISVENNQTAGIFAVADGVGGLAKGDIASRTAISGINQWWEQVFRGNRQDKKLLVHSLLQKLGELNHEIIDLSERYEERMATTLSVLLLHEDDFIVAHVGDSRIYRVRGRIQAGITQITKDHSCYVERQVDGRTVKKSVLTQWLGNKERFQYYSDLSQIKKNDIFIICSDGIYKRVSQEQILKIAKSCKHDMKLLCKTLIDTAILNGETDNISAIAVKVQS